MICNKKSNYIKTQILICELIAFKHRKCLILDSQYISNLETFRYKEFYKIAFIYLKFSQ